MSARPALRRLAIGALLPFAVSGIIASDAIAKPPPADLLLKNGRIYTVNPRQPLVEAVAVREGKIIDVGSTAELEHWAGKKTTVMDLRGHPVYPGFKDSHAHLLSLGLSRLNVDLTDTKSFDEVIARVKEAVKVQPPGTWVVGRGWHEGKWTQLPADSVRGFPVHRALSAATPEHPVMLERADGQAVLANARAMQLMGITAKTAAPVGGEIIQDERADPTGIFIDTASGLIKPPAPSADMKRRAWGMAFAQCLRAGVTAVDEAGLGYEDIMLLKQLAAWGQVPIRLYVMLEGWQTLKRFERPEIGVNRNLTIRAVKLYTDGALRSRGAALLEPYQDDPNNSGLIMTPENELREALRYALNHGFQVATHAIGDRGNRLILDLYEQALSKDLGGKDHRWRIEHAQVIDGADIPRFGKLGIIASMQTVHASSGRPWAADRLGMERVEEGAYAWRKLLASGAHIANGTDAPVENLDPIRNFYAAVTRMDEKGQPPGGFDPQQRMRREEALRAYTLEGAYATFTEREAGSIEVGKNADFAVLSRDIMEVPEAEILQARVEYTVVGGRIYKTGNK